MSGYKFINSPIGCIVPKNAVEGGEDTDGSKIYIGRAHFQGDLLPCKIVPQRAEAYVSLDSKEYRVINYEILVSLKNKRVFCCCCRLKLQWIRNSGSRIPIGAIVGGHTKSGDDLFIGRVRHGNALTVGKVHPLHGCLYIPYDGYEVSYHEYEILVLK